MYTKYSFRLAPRLPSIHYPLLKVLCNLPGLHLFILLTVIRHTNYYDISLDTIPFTKSVVLLSFFYQNPPITNM